MDTTERTMVTISTTVNVPVDRAWEYWTTPKHIMNWNNASPDWHTPRSENDLRTGGKFLSRMEARDGSFGFDFSGVYDEVKENELIKYTMGDGRQVTVKFTSGGEATTIEEKFEAESENPVDMQKQGWQAILDNFKKYAEENVK